MFVGLWPISMVFSVRAHVRTWSTYKLDRYHNIILQHCIPLHTMYVRPVYYHTIYDRMKYVYIYNFYVRTMYILRRNSCTTVM